MSPSCSTRSGPTSQSWKVTCEERRHKPDTPSRAVEKYVRHTVCFGARTNGRYHGPHHAGTRPTSDRRNKWSMYQAPRSQRYSSWHPTDSKPHCDLAERMATC